MKRKKLDNKMHNVAKQMPPLFHKIPNMDFDIHKSQVLIWLVNQESVLEYIWSAIKQSGAIKYNPDTKMWQGAEYKNDN